MVEVPFLDCTRGFLRRADLQSGFHEFVFSVLQGDLDDLLTEFSTNNVLGTQEVASVSAYFHRTCQGIC